MPTNLAFKIAGPDPNRALHIMALNGLYDEMDALGVLKHAVTEVLRDDIAIVSSFGADSAVLLHLVSLVDKTLPVYFLETGKHFPETLQYVETLKAHLGLSNVRWLRPDPKDIARFDPHGNAVPFQLAGERCEAECRKHEGKHAACKACAESCKAAITRYRALIG